jgi:outer membrane receptor protein involved in Fe transport
MKKFLRGPALLGALMMAFGAREASAADAAEVFLLDSLTLEGARAADSLRRADLPGAEAPAALQAGADSSAEALPGTVTGQGSISGKVVSEARGTAVPDARVIVAGRNLSANTDADGRFGFPGLPPGAYSLFLYHSSFAPLTVDSLRVVAGKDLRRRLSLPDKAVQGEAVRITGSATQASDAGMLFARKNSPAVSDGISAEQISKSPDADAAAALKRVTGISIAGDGLVYVRGLGERYVNMQLNGLTVSSPNPEKRVVPLDVFPTRLLENLSVSKTFTADQPAEFAGGSLQLRTKDYPDKRLIEFSAGAGYEPGSTGKGYLTYNGGALDWLGADDGTRKLPDIVPTQRFDNRSEILGATQAEREQRQREILASLPNVWTPYLSKAPVNQSYGVSLGNKIPLRGERVFGWLLGGNYSAKWGSDEEFVGLVGLDGQNNAVYSDRYTKQIGTEAIQWGVLGTATLQDGARHKLRFNFMANRDWEDEVTKVRTFREADSESSLVFEIAAAQQTLTNYQLEGSHRVAEDGTRLDWMAGFTSASRWEPDRRLSKYFADDPLSPDYNPEFPWRAVPSLGLRDRYWFDLMERGVGGKVDVEKPMEWGWFSEGSKLRGGVFAFGKHRDFDVRRLSYVEGSATGGSALKHGPLEGFFGTFDGSLDSGYISNTDENEKDDYAVDDLQMAAHAQADWMLFPQWRAIAGLRLQYASVQGESFAQDGTLSPPEDSIKQCGANGRCRLPFGYEQAALLPAASVVYALTERQNARVSWTRTFSFPEYREMAPLLFFSYQEALEVYGNVRLKPTDIQNYDFRWEWFPSASELLALSLFYKHFDDPVETRITQSGSNNRALFQNAPSADLYGVETEVRAGLARFHDLLASFEVVGNFTWIRSEVKGEQARPMQGQSPYLINAILFFEPFREKTQMSLLYNKFGRRLSKVGVLPFPDVYEESRESLEFSYSQRVYKGAKMKFTAKNLTNAELVQTQGGLVTRRVKPGPVYSLGATYAF